MKYVLLFIVVGLVGACNKYKKPTVVSFVAQQRTAVVLQDRIQIQQGVFRLVEFEFDGKRKKGDDVEIERYWTNGLELQLNSSTLLSELQFQIPQGVFDSYEVELKVDQIGNDAAIELSGVYINNAGNEVPFQLNIQEKQVFELKGKDPEGHDMVLDAEVATTSIIRFDVAYWLDFLSINQMESANLEYINGQYVLLIDQDHNSSLYEQIVARLNQSDDLQFHE